MTDILSLGTEYVISDPSGAVINKIQILSDRDVLDAALGEFNGTLGDVSAYLNESISVLTGFQKVNPHKILWYATEEDEVILSEIVEYAVENGYDRIILEHLEPLKELEE